jgi:hypothetical protein
VANYYLGCNSVHLQVPMMVPLLSLYPKEPHFQDRARVAVQVL